MARALAILTVVTFATLSLHAEEKFSGYLLLQNGEWPTSWPKELDPLRHHMGKGRFTATFSRSGEDQLHFGIRFTTRKECEAAWPHLLKVRSKGTSIVLRSGPSYWLGGTSHGVCVHQTPAIRRVGGGNLPITKTPREVENLLSADEVRSRTPSSLALFVDGEIVDLNRISLPEDAPIIDRRVKQPMEAPDAATLEIGVAKTATRKLRDFAHLRSFGSRYNTRDLVLSMYDHLWAEVKDPAKTEVIKKELARYGRVVPGISSRVWGADVYDDVDTEAARTALAKVDGVGKTGTRKRGAYDKRIPDLAATLNIGRKTYPVDYEDDLDLTFFLTNVSNEQPHEFLSLDSTLCQLDLKLEGPGAKSTRILMTRESSLVKQGKVIQLKPGKSYRIPVTSLWYGHEYWGHQWQWTRPGEYTLPAAYVIGEVRYEAPPVKLKVVTE